MKKNLLKVVNVILNAPGKGLVKLAAFVSPFNIKNQYIRKLYQNNINLFRTHLALSVAVMALPIIAALAALLSVAVVVAFKDFLFEIADDIYYEARAVYRPLARGFKEGLSRD